LQAVCSSDTQTTLVEKMVYSVFFAESGWPGGEGRPRVRPVT
jgi:hypothetical protein